MEAQISTDVAVVIERRKSSHPWAEFSWKGIGVVEAAEAPCEWQVVHEDEASTQFLFGPVSLILHRKLGEAYDANMETGTPSLWLVLDDADTDPVPYKVRGVTADPYEAQGMLDAGDGLIERVPMPADILQWTVAFLKQMPEPEAFKKRRRKSAKTEEQQFGKVPIFEEGGRLMPGEGE